MRAISAVGAALRFATISSQKANVFGTGEAGVRSLSAIAGTALIPIAYLCGRELLSRAAGYVAAALLAVSPFMIWYSQEARAYMLFTALCGLSLLFFARARREPSTANITWWAICSALALLTHFFGGFLVAPEAVWLIIALRSRRVVIATAVLAVVQAAVIPIAVNDLSHPLLGWIKQFPLHTRVEQVPVAFGLGTLYQSSLVTHGLLAAALVAAACVALLLLGGEPPIVAYQGVVVAQPLSLYLRGLPWDPPSEAPVNVSEVDVIGSPLQTLAPMPPGIRLIATTTVDGNLVERFAVDPRWSSSPTAIANRARVLLSPRAPSAYVVVQREARPQA